MKETHCRVACYVPNIIGYLRFITLFGSLFMSMSPRWQKFLWFLVFYAISYFLDIFDGFAARKCGQTSRYGAALDMICDRLANAVMYLILASHYPGMISFAFYAMLLLDFGSHWLQFLSSATTGAHHKGKNEKENWLVDLYYNNSVVFSIVVPGAEIATFNLYILKKSETYGPNPTFQAVTAVLCVILAFKMFVNIHQWNGAIQRLVEWEENGGHNQVAPDADTPKTASTAKPRKGNSAANGPSTAQRRKVKA